MYGVWRIKGTRGRDMPDVALGSPIRLWNKVCQRPEALIGVAAKEIHFLRMEVW